MIAPVAVLVNGKSLSTKPSKIVAGMEAEKTNEFLQALAAAVNKKVSSLFLSPGWHKLSSIKG